VEYAFERSACVADTGHHSTDAFGRSDIGGDRDNIRTQRLKFRHEFTSSRSRGALATGKDQMARALFGKPSGQTAAKPAKSAGDKVKSFRIDAERRGGRLATIPGSVNRRRTASSSRTSPRSVVPAKIK
jgi:hypothetical protein